MTKQAHNQLQVFEHENFCSIRVVEIDGTPWFVGKDVADNLGYGRADNALRRHVDAEDKLTHQISASGQGRKMILINESGLYSLILSSKLPQAKAFKRWVTSEVLPSIKRHSAYVAPHTLDEMMRSPEFVEALMDTLADEHKRNRALEGKISELSPKARYCEQVLLSGEAVQVSVIAKDYGMAAAAFNRLLNGLGVQYKIGGKGAWLLYQPYAGKGYTKTKTFYTPGGECVVHTYWTQKGRRFLYETLADAGIYPAQEFWIEGRTG